MKKLSKLLSVLLTMVMLFSIAVPANVYAAAKPKATSISSVTAKGGAFTVKWKKVSGVTGYQVKYSTSSKFAKDKTKTVKVSKASTASKTISGLTSRKKYYVRLRAYKTVNGKKYYSSWSDKKSVTTSAYYCDEGGSHHRRNVGQIGWYNTYNEAMEARIKYCEEHPNLTHYTIVRCSCGLYTAYIN